MDPTIDFGAIAALFAHAQAEGRQYLYEFEVYRLLGLSGAETPPNCRFLPRGQRPTDNDLTAMPGDRVVLKIVSPMIIHKTEVGGVRIVDNETNRVRSAVRRMLYEVPETYAAWLERRPETAPPPYRGLVGSALVAAVSRDLQGVLLVQYMPPDSSAFGNELIVGLRHTREFGMILSAGLGGTDTELYARRFRKGQAIIAASTAMTDGQEFFELFRQTIAYRKLAGLTRGQRRIVTDEQLIECFDSFIRLGNHFSPAGDQTEVVIEELEINPFAFTDYLMVPLDGMCRFTRPVAARPPRPIDRITNLLHPETIGLVGVSTTRRNFGRIICENILAEGFPREQVVLIREDGASIEGLRSCRCLSAVDHPLDLLIVAVGAEHVPAMIEEILRLGTVASVMLIAGGLGETSDSRNMADRIMASIDAGRLGSDATVFLGANCMGVISRPGRYDTWFIPEEKLAKDRQSPWHRAALISQSGAFMLHRTTQRPELRPAYLVSMGNQTDLTLGDMVAYFSKADDVDVIAVYAEGFRDGDGLAFCRAVRAAVLAGKEVIFYKAGRTPEGKAATSGHTASLAGDYMVCESCVRQAGAVVARDFTEFQELFFLAETLAGKTVAGNRLAAVSGAGFEAVGMADSIVSDDFAIELASFSAESRQTIAAILERKGLQPLVTLTNPLDINPAADDETHAQIAEVLLADRKVDALILSLDPLSPAMRTLGEEAPARFDMEAAGSIKHLIIDLAARSSKPLVTVVDGGTLYEPLRRSLIASNVPVFDVCDKAVAALALYLEGRLAAETIRARHGLEH